MKKLALLALVVLASASFSTVSASSKKDKKVVAAPVAATKIVTSSDSISYAAGMAMTNGLIPYLKQRFDVDTTNMADFIKGYEDGIGKANDKKFKSYNAGIQIATMVVSNMLPGITKELSGSKDSINADLFSKGFVASLQNDSSLYSQKKAETYYKERAEALKKAKEEGNRKAGEAFLAANKSKEGVVTMPDGLQYKVLTKGTGAIPKSTDNVIVKYEGKLIDGTVFDSSYKRKEQTNTFRADQVIKGWTEALTMMPVGSKWEIYLPQELAYGERAAGQIQPYSALIFTVELVGIEAPKADAAAKKEPVKASTNKKATKTGKKK